MTRYGSSPRSTAPRTAKISTESRECCRCCRLLTRSLAPDADTDTGGDCMGCYKLYTVQVDGRYL